jgi:hypothetical protein
MDLLARAGVCAGRRPQRMGFRWTTGTRRGSECQSPAMPNGGCRLHGGGSPGAPKRNKNAFRHGRYPEEGIANRREVAALFRTMKTLMRTTSEREGASISPHLKTKGFALEATHLTDPDKLCTLLALLFRG